MNVSVPEKTLEHWVSQYLTYRYRSNAALWWPVRGEDVDVQSLPHLPGKAVQLELKTTTPGAKGRHKVIVDIGQLIDYLRSDVPVYYVIPRPTWSGELKPAAHSSGVPATDIAFSRSGHKWWFAEWMIVLTAKQVAKVLSKEVAAHGSTVRGKRERLVLFTVGPRGRVTARWGTGVKPPVIYEWRDFWTRLGRCGEPDWPQVVRVPSEHVQGRMQLSRDDVRSALADAANSIDEDGRFQGELTDFVASETEGFRIMEPADEVPDPLLDSEDEEHRQIVFLDARALQN